MAPSDYTVLDTLRHLAVDDTSRLEKNHDLTRDLAITEELHISGTLEWRLNKCII